MDTMMELSTRRVTHETIPTMPSSTASKSLIVARMLFAPHVLLCLYGCATPSENRPPSTQNCVVGGASTSEPQPSHKQAPPVVDDATLKEITEQFSKVGDTDQPEPTGVFNRKQYCCMCSSNGQSVSSCKTVRVWPIAAPAKCILECGPTSSGTNSGPCSNRWQCAGKER